VRLASYEGVVLIALEEVDSALSQHLRERQRHARLDTSLADSRRAAELARVRYTEGAESFISVLDAERTLLSAEEQLTTSDIELARSLTNLYRALGGGWQNAVDVSAPVKK
jgi:Outer membrane protein